MFWKAFAECILEMVQDIGPVILCVIVLAAIILSFIKP